MRVTVTVTVFTAIIILPVILNFDINLSFNISPTGAVEVVVVVVGADPVGVVAAVGAVGVEPLEACGVVGLQSSTFNHNIRNKSSISDMRGSESGVEPTYK